MPEPVNITAPVTNTKPVTTTERVTPTELVNTTERVMTTSQEVITTSITRPGNEFSLRMSLLPKYKDCIVYLIIMTLHMLYILLDIIPLPTAGLSFTTQEDVSTTTEHSNITPMINGGVIAGISTAIVTAIIAILLIIIVLVIFITRRRAKNNTSIHLADSHHNDDDDEMRIDSTYVPMDTIITDHIPVNVNEAYGTTIPLEINQTYGILPFP